MIPDIKNLVLIDSPIDHRDIQAEAVISPLLGETQIPESFEVAPLTQKNQGNEPECVGYSGSTVKENSERAEGNPITVFDARWFYAQCKLIDGLPDFPGTFLRAVMLVMKNIGALPMGGDPNDAKLIAKYRIKGFVRVELTEDAIKRAIYTFGALIMGFRGSNGGWQTAYIRPPLPGEDIWGHATAAIGYMKEILSKNQNSWGENWGDHGKFYVPKNYSPFEVWAIVKELPNNWQELLPDKENRPAYIFNNNLGMSQKLNPEVKILQECLIYDGELSREDVGQNLGYFGQKTKKAVIEYQKRHGIPQTGFVGVLTRADLNKRFPV